MYLLYVCVDPSILLLLFVVCAAGARCDDGVTEPGAGRATGVLLCSTAG